MEPVGMFSWLWEVLLKETGKAIFKRAISALKAAFYKNGKLDGKRTIFLIVWIGGTFLVYLTPFLIPYIQILFEISSLKHYAERLTNDQEYRSLTQYFYVLMYFFISGGVVLRKSWRGQRSVAEELPTANEQNIIEFVRKIELVSGNLCANDEERKQAVDTIAERILASKRTRMMVINGYHDLVEENSAIFQALNQKGRDLNLQVLLLDPFSSYASERAKQLKQETDIYLSRMRYIRDYLCVSRSLDDLRKKGATVEYRIYCSNPFFRMYLFDRDLVLQSYQAYRHGNETPLYNFRAGERSLFYVGKEIFDYYWNKGFLHDEAWLKKMGTALTVYLATTMYGIYKDAELPADAGEQRKLILDYVEKQKKEAESLDKQGKLTNLDH